MATDPLSYQSELEHPNEAHGPQDISARCLGGAIAERPGADGPVVGEAQLCQQ